MLSVGIDISSNHITAIELLSSRKNILLKNAANFEISPEAIEKGELQDSTALSKGLKDAWKKFKISGRNVHVGLSNLKAIVREVELPLLDEEEIKNSLKYQINDFIPIPKDNILYDFYIMDKKEGSSKIMIAGAMKSMVKNVIDSVKDAGLITQTIDLNCFSLFRTIERTYGVKGSKNLICAVNIGRDVSIIEIIENDTLKFPRFVSNSVSTFVNNIAKSTGKDLVSSSNLLYDFDFSSICSDDLKKKETTKEGTPGGPQVVDDSVSNIIRTTADNFVDEIKMSIEHYLQEGTPGTKIEKILIAGEDLRNIEKYITYKTEYNVERLDISSSFSLDLISRSPVYKEIKTNQMLNPLAIGMALRGMQQ